MSVFWRFKNNKNILFTITFSLLLIGRLMLLGQGHLDDTDEIPFLTLLNNYDRLFDFDIDAWNDQVFVMWSTHIETLIRLCQAFFLKIYADIINLPPESTQALVVMGFFNVIVSMLISFVFYRILLRLAFKYEIAILGMLMYAAFVNTNLYIRHVISYDTSLLIHLFALYVLLGNQLKRKHYIFAGILSAIGYFTYYGNFMMYLIVWLIGMYRLPRSMFKYIEYSSYLVIPSFLLLFILEGISQVSSHSYIDFMFLFSTTIFHGSPDETLKYAYIYMSLVEGLWGYLIFFLCLLGILFAFFYRKSYSESAKFFLFSGISVYLVYGIYAVITGEMVFYGRVFHMYFPFMIVAVLMIIQRYHRLIQVFYILAFVNGIFVVKELNSIGYPRSIIYNYGLFEKESRDYQFVHELKPGIEYNLKKYYFEGNDVEIPNLWLPNPNFTPKIDGDLTLKNFGFYFHYPDSFMESYQEYSASKDEKLVLEKLHFMSYPAYTFEYCTKYGRAFFLDKKLKIGIYQESKED